ncbi:MAG: winged helix DNA-binding protein [Planctomycetaceae bacterium]|nr:winged helix DNA-binding protein [Planctomycetaceae bacterium]
MSATTEQSDATLLDQLRVGPKSIADLEGAMAVTATAVRQRLSRLMALGLVERELHRAERGRPSHRYRLTEKARRQNGSNFADLALVLWRELRAIKDPEVRRGLLARVADAMAAEYEPEVSGSTAAERMESVSQLLAERRVPFQVDASGALPVLTALDCPYPQLAEQDRGICAVEKMLFSRLLEQDVRLSQCRLDGHACCQFETTN